MNLRDHVEIAVLVSRLAMGKGSNSPGWSEQSRASFWNQVRYLEHLWSKELEKAVHHRKVSSCISLIEEMLATRILTRTVAVASCCASDGDHRPVVETWTRHQSVIESSLETAQVSLDDQQAISRVQRLRRRLDHWGDFLISRSHAHEDFAADSSRCQEFRESYQSDEVTVWPLLLRGISHAVPMRQIEDVARGGVHRLLQSAALSLISPCLFLPDGRIKPRMMRLIEGGAAVLS